MPIGRPFDPAGHDAETIDDRFLIFHSPDLQLHFREGAHQLNHMLAVSRFRCFRDFALKVDLLPAQRLSALVKRKRLRVAFTRIFRRRLFGGCPQPRIADLLFIAFNSASNP